MCDMISVSRQWPQFSRFVVESIDDYAKDGGPEEV